MWDKSSESRAAGLDPAVVKHAGGIVSHMEGEDLRVQVIAGVQTKKKKFKKALEVSVEIIKMLWVSQRSF